jgi:hypothetical protein
MSLGLRELDDLVLDRWAVSRSAAGNGTAVEGRLTEMTMHNVPESRTRVGEIARSLIRTGCPIKV